MSKFENLRRQTCRLKDYDYSAEGLYFVTICTRLKECYFGSIENGEMQLSEIGKIAKSELLKTQTTRENLEIDSWCIMPNHIHVILIIGTTCRGMSLRNEFSKPVKDSLSMIVNHYKGAVTKQCREQDFSHFSWQPRYYEHIIRNEQDLEKIREYIENNTIKWELDENNPYKL